MDDLEAAMRAKAKQLMRRRFRSHRSALPASAIADRSAALNERLLSLPEMEAATAVALFWPIVEKKEVDLRAVDTALRERGARLAYPEIDPETRVMCFRELADISALEQSPLGFMAPPPSAHVLEVDVVVVPGLAFDARGHRIGYGGGFYDQALAKACPPARAIGVAFDFQLAADIPDQEGDVPVHMIVTDKRTLRVDAS